MSGGAFYYASTRSLGHDDISSGDLDDLVNATAAHAPDIAKEARAVIDAWNAARTKAAEDWARLRPVLKAVEWQASGDWSAEDVKREIAAHRPARTPNGHSYPAESHRVVMVDGVERYRQNRIVRDLVNRARDNDLDLNCVSRDQQQGRYTLEERKELYRLIGYSLSGFGDVFAEDEDESDVQE